MCDDDDDDDGDGRACVPKCLLNSRTILFKSFTCIYTLYEYSGFYSISKIYNHEFMSFSIIFHMRVCVRARTNITYLSYQIYHDIIHTCVESGRTHI